MSLFLKQYKYNNGKIYLSIVDGFRKDGKVKQKVIKKLGYLDDLSKQYKNPIEHFKNEIEKMKQEETFSFPTSIDKEELLENDNELLNIGYVFIKILYQQLGIDNFLKEKKKDLNISYDLNKIFSLLVYSWFKKRSIRK